MQDKLQELTDKLFKEGLSKGQDEGARILESAKEEAAAIVAAAKKEAATIISDAEKTAADTKAKADSDIRASFAQSIQATKKDIENLILAKIAGEQVSGAMKSADFVKEILKTVAAGFNKDEAQDLAVVLPASMQAEMEPFVNGELAKALSSNVEASFSKKLSGGFSIGPKDGGWFISLSDDVMCELITEYLRPVTKKILFG